ncbi:hypothetical protein ACFLR2_00735 [Chlamydiota bacterium]
MALKSTLTNEQLNQRFESPFALVAYAINMARARVHRGEGLDSNPATDVLDLIASGQDLLCDDEDDEEDEGEEEAE